MRRVPWPAIAALAFSCIPLRAMDVKTYREWLKKGGDELKRSAVDSYVSGVGNGISWANAQLGTLRREKLYCAPVKLALGLASYKDILDRQIAEQAKRRTDDELGKLDIELLLMNGLIETFPCPHEK